MDLKTLGLKNGFKNPRVKTLSGLKTQAQKRPEFHTKGKILLPELTLSDETSLVIILIKCVTFASFHFCSISRNKNRERKMKPGVGINQNFLGYPLQPFVTKPGYRFSLLTKLRNPSRPSASTPFTGLTLCDFIILAGFD